MNSARRFSLLAVSLASCCAAMSAQAAAGDWQQTVIIYGMGAAIDGDATIGDLTVPVDVSMSEVFDALGHVVLHGRRDVHGPRRHGREPARHRQG